MLHIAPTNARAPERIYSILFPITPLSIELPSPENAPMINGIPVSAVAAV